MYLPNRRKAFRQQAEVDWWQYCVLLCHMDGTDGSTSFPDSSDSNHTLTPVGDTQVDTSQSVFGGASALFDPNDRMTIPSSTDFQMGTGDFAIDLRVRLENLPGVAAWIMGGLSNLDLDISYYIGAQVLRIWLDVKDYDFSFTMAADTWYHLLVCVKTGTLRVYVDGNQIGSDTAVTESIPETGLVLGAQYDGSPTLDGWIDEMRVLKGSAAIDDSSDPLYIPGVPADGFTPPTEAYSQYV